MNTGRALAVALALLLVALLLPPLELPRRSFDTIVVFDITQSMNVEDTRLDGRPASRLAFAREAARRALRALPCGSRVGWGAFTEYRTLLLLAPIEVCANYDDLLATLASIDGQMRWGEASQVSKAVFWSLRIANQVGDEPNVVFLSDGHEAPPLDGQPALFPDIRRGHIRGWIMGVGGEVPSPIPRTDAEGRPTGVWRADEVVQREAGGAEHLSALREGHLKALARQTGLDYARLYKPAALGAAMTDARLARSRAVPTELYWLPAALALVVLALQFRPRRSRCPS